MKKIQKNVQLHIIVSTVESDGKWANPYIIYIDLSELIVCRFVTYVIRR